MVHPNNPPAKEAARPILAKADPAHLPARIEGMRDLAAAMWARQQGTVQVEVLDGNDPTRRAEFEALLASVRGTDSTIIHNSGASK